MIKVKNLIKKYDDNIIINNVSFDINNGDFVCIIGESGAGKSTLLYLLSGLAKTTSGSIYYDDIDITKLNDDKLSKWRKDQTTFIFQNNNLINELTVKDNLEIALSIKNNSLKFNIQNIESILSDVGMSGYYNRVVGSLSGGQQQRVAIARSLISNSNIIFADEPTGSLDSKNAEAILNLFKLANEKYNKTIIMVTHSEKQLKYCKKIIKISDGQIS